MIPPVPNVTRYAQENVCPHCHRADSIDVVDIIDEPDSRWGLGNVFYDEGDEICHCNACGKTFTQHYERTFIGQTESGQYSMTDVPPTRETRVVTAAENLAQYVEHLLTRIANLRDDWHDGFKREGEPEHAPIVERVLTELLDDRAYTRTKAHLAELTKALDDK